MLMKLFADARNAKTWSGSKIARHTMYIQDRVAKRVRAKRASMQVKHGVGHKRETQSADIHSSMECALKRNQVYWIEHIRTDDIGEYIRTLDKEVT